MNTITPTEYSTNIANQTESDLGYALIRTVDYRGDDLAVFIEIRHNGETLDCISARFPDQGLQARAHDYVARHIDARAAEADAQASIDALFEGGLSYDEAKRLNADWLLADRLAGETDAFLEATARNIAQHTGRPWAEVQAILTRNRDEHMAAVYQEMGWHEQAAELTARISANVQTARDAIKRAQAAAQALGLPADVLAEAQHSSRAAALVHEEIAKASAKCAAAAPQYTHSENHRVIAFQRNEYDPNEYGADCPYCVGGVILTAHPAGFQVTRACKHAHLSPGDFRAPGHPAIFRRHFAMAPRDAHIIVTIDQVDPNGIYHVNAWASETGMDRVAQAECASRDQAEDETRRIIADLHNWGYTNVAYSALPMHSLAERQQAANAPARQVKWVDLEGADKRRAECPYCATALLMARLDWGWRIGQACEHACSVSIDSNQVEFCNPGPDNRNGSPHYTAVKILNQPPAKPAPDPDRLEAAYSQIERAGLDYDRDDRDLYGLTAEQFIAAADAIARLEDAK